MLLAGFLLGVFTCGVLLVIWREWMCVTKRFIVSEKDYWESVRFQAQKMTDEQEWLNTNGSEGL